MTDITHDNIFTNDVAPRLRRILDEEIVAPRATDHELAPHMPAPQRTGGQMMIEQLIGHSDKATDIVIDLLDKLIEEAVKTKEAVMTSKLHLHDVIRQHMVISECAMKSTQQFAQQLVDATNTLVMRTNGK